jgi:hypothetical protein
MATQVKPTKKNSPAIHHGANRDNAPADVYAKPHTMSGKNVPIQGAQEYKTDPNTMSSAESTPGGMPARRVSVGNITRGPKTDGIKIRGTGAATKGVMARGPMA